MKMKLRAEIFFRADTAFGTMKMSNQVEMIKLVVS